MFLQAHSLFLSNKNSNRNSITKVITTEASNSLKLQQFLNRVCTPPSHSEVGKTKEILIFTNQAYEKTGEKISGSTCEKIKTRALEEVDTDFTSEQYTELSNFPKHENMKLGERGCLVDVSLYYFCFHF